MKDVTIKLAEFNAGLTYNQISGLALEKIKFCLLDSLGCAFLGAKTEWGRIVNDFVQSQGGVAESTLWATRFAGPAANVVLGNGTMIHSWDFDDYHMTKLHPGAVVMPAVLAVAEAEGLDGRRMMTAMACGYETMIHISRGLNPGASRLLGWHLTGTCGTFAAAAAVGRLWRFDTQTMASALGMAGTQSAGLWAFTADGSYSKRFHPGRSAQSGIMAAALARRGYKGPTMILEAQDGGFMKATSNDYNLDKVLAGLGEKFDTEDVVLKPYSACGSLHSSIDAALFLKKEHGFEAEEIDHVNVYNSTVVNVQCGFPYRPLGLLQAQMSLKYCVARALLDGGLSVAAFSDEKLSEPKAVDLAGRVNFVRHDEIDRIYPQKFPSIVEIVMGNGTKVETRVDAPKGSVENPMSWKEIKAKFEMNCEGVINEEQAEAVIRRVESLEEMKDVKELTRLLKI